MSVINFKHATVTLQDGTAVTPQTMVLNVGNGDATITRGSNVTAQFSRGRLSGLKEGDDVAMSVSMELNVDWFDVAAGTLTADDLLFDPRNSGWVTTYDGCGGPFTFDMIIEFTDECDGNLISILIPQIALNGDQALSLKESTLNFSGLCNATNYTRTVAPAV